MGVLQAWSSVVTVLQLHSSVQQGQVPPHDESVWAVCRKEQRGEGHSRHTPALGVLLAALVKVQSPTRDVVDECCGEDTVQHRAGKVSQLEERHEDVDGGERRAERL